jgi:hypothetical protein
VNDELDTGVERKVRRVDREVHGIYAMLLDISSAQRRHGDTLATHGVTWTEMLGRLQQQGGRLDRIEGDLGRIDDKVGHLSAAQLRQDERLGELDEKLDSIIDLIRDDH